MLSAVTRVWEARDTWLEMKGTLTRPVSEDEFAKQEAAVKAARQAAEEPQAALGKTLQRLQALGSTASEADMVAHKEAEAAVQAAWRHLAAEEAQLAALEVKDKPDRDEIQRLSLLALHQVPCHVCCALRAVRAVPLAPLRAPRAPALPPRRSGFGSGT
jgi:hypothetical protein